MSDETYEKLKKRLQDLKKEGKLSSQLSDEERADWAYGTTKLENDAVTREMAETAVQDKKAQE